MSRVLHKPRGIGCGRAPAKRIAKPPLQIKRTLLFTVIAEVFEMRHGFPVF